MSEVDSESKITLGQILGSSFNERFMDFDMGPTQRVLGQLEQEAVHDLAHAELQQQRALRCSNNIGEFLGIIVKNIAYLESKIQSTRNKFALTHIPKDEDGKPMKVTVDVRNMLLKSCPEADPLEETLARLKGAKEMLAKKYDSLTKAHYHYKEIADFMRGGLMRGGGNAPVSKSGLVARTHTYVPDFEK
jgi:hypothetical protein